jgi:DNA-binding SARP family transcriptional activator
VTEASPQGRWRLQVCGALSIERDGERVEQRLPGRQGRLLVTFLVVNRSRAVARQEVALALWREPDPGAIDARLNPLLSKVRSVFGQGAIEAKTGLRLNVPDAWVDLEAAISAVHQAESAVAQAAWARAWGPALTALIVAERDFLVGEDALWIDDVRNELMNVRLRALECYASANVGVGGTELTAAVRAARQLVQLAPLRESGYRLLMEALSGEDNVAEALRVYAELSERLRDQIGVSPSPATRETYERLLART